MKKLAVVLALVVSGFVNSQDSLKYVFSSYTQSSIQFLKDINYNNYCSPEIRNAFETNSIDSLMVYRELSSDNLKRFHNQFNKYKIAAGNNYKKVKNVTYTMTFSDWLDTKENYNPIFNLFRNPNDYVANIILIKPNTTKYKAIEIVETCILDYNNKNVLIYSTNIFVQDINGFWDIITNSYSEGVLECAHCAGY
jgi:hypothetical protein